MAFIRLFASFIFMHVMLIPNIESEIFSMLYSSLNFSGNSYAYFALCLKGITLDKISFKPGFALFIIGILTGLLAFILVRESTAI